jgi:hypothetical protein
MSVCYAATSLLSTFAQSRMSLRSVAAVPRPLVEDVQRDQFVGKHGQVRWNGGRWCTSRLAGDVCRGDHALGSEPHQQLARYGISAAEVVGSVRAHVPATDRCGEAQQLLEVLA